MQQKLPHKPAYLSQAEFDFILQRDGHRCVHYGKCPRAGGNVCCDENLDFDHEQPKELGGDDSFANIRLCCACHNRGRQLESLEKWKETNHWDRPVVPGRLRQIQVIAGWDAISKDVQPHLADYMHRPEHFRRILLGNTTFLPGATGIGKAILAQSIFYKINELIGPGYPRVKHVLWLTNDTTLRDTGRVELESDAVDVGFASSAPTVHIAKSFADVALGPNGSDIKMATVESLWVVKIDGELRRSDDEKRNALAKYDTIVFDECDWGVDQVRSIAQVASHALQFSLSASPPIPEITDDKQRVQEFLKRFVLISPDAIADYRRALELDQCLKFIDDEVITAGKHDGYIARTRGVLKEHAGNMPPDHPLYRGAIMQAIEAADNLETRMRKADPDNAFSPHVMIRMSRVSDLKAMAADLKEQLPVMYQNQRIKNPGWGVTVVYQGLGRDIPYEERDLSAKDGQGKWRHPFMLARNKGNKGKATDKSKRILLMCNIGVRGINNWTISHIVDCTDTLTPTELIQFDHGRPLRWRDHLRSWIDDKSPFAEFATARVFIPPTGFQDEKRKALNEAAAFIRDMLDRIGNAGFLTWLDLIQGRRSTDADVVIDVSNRPLIDHQKFKAQHCLGVAFAATGQLTPDLVEAAIDQGFHNINPTLREKLVSYAMRLVEKPAFRERELLSTPLVNEFDQRPASVMEKLKPQETYDIADLIRCVRSDPFYETKRERYLLALSAATDSEAHFFAVDSVSARLREQQIANYRPAARTHTLHGNRKDPNDETGVLRILAKELNRKLKDAGQEPSDIEENGKLVTGIGKVFESVIGTAKHIFDIDDASEGGPMDQPAYHYAILGRYRETIQLMARSRLIRDGVLGMPLQRLATFTPPSSTGPEPEPGSEQAAAAEMPAASPAPGQSG